ncbi:MAG: glycosyltransferase family 2 protein, partial [Chloroflexi bacterium]|nr:glycosyltransferase family 2 protein [Chloroflexota bacterium]
MYDLTAFLIFWGVWLLVPILVDGLTMLSSLAGVLITRWRRRRVRPQPLIYTPFISIVVPVYNSADTLEACLRSIAAQDYAHDHLEVLLINNGSTDHSFAIYNRLQDELGIWQSWHSIISQGKTWALNAGIHLARGQYILNVDSDVVLAPDAVRQVIEAMEADPALGAVTGAIQVLLPPPTASLGQRVLA